MQLKHCCVRETYYIICYLILCIYAALKQETLLTAWKLSVTRHSSAVGSYKLIAVKPAFSTVRSLSPSPSAMWSTSLKQLLAKISNFSFVIIILKIPLRYCWPLNVKP